MSLQTPSNDPFQSPSSDLNNQNTTTPSQSPNFSTTEQTPSATPLGPVKRSRKKMVIGVVAGVIGLLLLGGGIAFAVWNSSPQKILNDSLSNLLNTPPKGIDATAAISVDETNFKVTATSSSDANKNAQANVKFTVTGGGTAVNANVDAITASNGDIYIRVNDAKKLLDQFTQGSPEFASAFAGIVQKIDTKWVKITQADIKKISGEEKSPSSTCASDTITAFQKDAGQKKEISDLYVKNQFVTVKEKKADEAVSGRNSYHFVLNTDQAKAKAFASGLEQTQIYKKLKSCLGDSAKNSSSTDSKESDDTVNSFEVWIDKSSRQMTKISLTSTSAKDKGKAQIDAILGYQTKAISLPTTTTSVDELQQEFENIFSSAIQSSDTSFGSTELEQ